MKSKNEFEKELDSLNEWQQNQYNPGHYIGTGRVPRTVLNLSKYPWILILLGIMTIVPVVMQIIKLMADEESFISNIPSLLFGLGLGGVLLYGGIARMRSNRRSKQ